MKVEIEKNWLGDSAEHIAGSALGIARGVTRRAFMRDRNPYRSTHGVSTVGRVLCLL